MGGNKKKPSQSNASKSQENKGNKKEETKKIPKTQQKQRLSVLIEDAQGLKTLDSMKAITVQSLARSLGVKISVANNYLRNLENKNIVKMVGGYSGHRIYQKIK
ncbi:MarR family transcriptional regulator [Candidatus Nitrosocosmicus franklandus]|uniref:30S ribosomal protein S25e n=1 Tax=Candidatus Nitrosocosmicus franklandianus TaxID=1798806 RepID=A0A484IHH2_9ARCH|nr:MarR family transcriptional regulator [Candidatus Nitrosocosmicus franklandus]VFJ15462.1 30S ribosomal protein S25e [Candidatus Nitrosocosmicus franklandus]